MNKHYFWFLGKRFAWWVFRHPLSLSANGKWPLNVWLYKYGIAFHGGDIADAHIQVC